MNKVVKAVLTLLGVTLIGGIVVRERNTISDLRKRLFEVRWYGTEERKN